LVLVMWVEGAGSVRCIFCDYVSVVSSIMHTGPVSLVGPALAWVGCKQTGPMAMNLVGPETRPLLPLLATNNRDKNLELGFNPQNKGEPKQDTATQAI
jgi:hypothetical protein